MITIDYTISIGNILTFGGMVAGAISAAVWQVRRIDAKVDKSDLGKITSELGKVAGDLAAKAWQKDLEALRYEMMKDFVSVRQMEATEARMTAHMDMLANEIRGLRSDLIMVLRDRPHGA